MTDQQAQLDAFIISLAVLVSHQGGKITIPAADFESVEFGQLLIEVKDGDTTLEYRPKPRQ